MIYKDEIDRVARELDVGHPNVERDYVFGWLLSKIYSNSVLSQRLVLKGGNALRKGYFPGTRFSGDLDFVTDGAFAPDELKQHLIDVTHQVTAASGVVFRDRDVRVDTKKRVDKDIQALEARLYFKDFYDKPNSIVIRTQLDVTEYERLALPAVNRSLIHNYSDAAACTGTIRCMALEEILASKLKCLLQRRHVADLFDYVYWLAFQQDAVNLADVLRVFLRKTIYSTSPGAALSLLLGLPFQFLRQAWGEHIVCPVTARTLQFEDAIGRFYEHMRVLFRGYSEDRGWGASGRFFPPEIRNVIIDAGTAQRVLRMKYRGEERFVEPYSLRFRTKKDGDAREYFFGWKLSGGTSAPGIKMFTAGDFESAEVTTTGFEPRFTIEVAKAGDVSQSGIFVGRGSGGSYSGAHQRRARRGGFRYLFRCAMCNRLFARQRYDSSARAHRLKNGMQCSSSFTTYVGTRS